MNGAGERKIEIFAPFSAALDLTKLILFQPFDIAKWLTIGFAAFLAGLADGTHLGGGNPFGGDWNYKSKSWSSEVSAVQDQLVHWLVAGLIGFVVVAALIAILVFLWVGSRGRFMFIDCIVRNRAAIAAPWREFRREGNALFVFSLLALLAWLIVWGLAMLPLAIPFFTTGDLPTFAPLLILYLVIAVAVLIPLSIAWAVAVWFMVPIMYRQRCGPLAALSQVLKLVGAHPGPFILWVLFVLVLLVAGGLVSCIVTCLTCCVAAIPYVGTVVLLPLYTFYYAFTLLFLRQFGPEYDAWANLAPVVSPEPAPDRPPDSLPPPSAQT